MFNILHFLENSFIFEIFAILLFAFFVLSFSAFAKASDKFSLPTLIFSNFILFIFSKPDDSVSKYALLFFSVVISFVFNLF